jgi:hypothetical protein
MNAGLALGCSHTAGIGIDISDCYVNVLSNYYQIPIKNKSMSGASYEQIEQNLVNEIKNDCPDFVIAQWPNPFRRTIWYEERAIVENINSAGLVFKQLLKLGERNFYTLWMQSIITCNALCTASQVPIVNIMLENVEEKYHQVLNNEGIVLHVDEKLPGKTWLFDSAASDNLHHSARCHAAWADRLVGLIDEITAR